jgi:hypothetical protein
MFSFPLPAGSSDPIDIGDGMRLVGFERAAAQLVPEVEATLNAAGWTVSLTGGDHMGGMWIIDACKGDERWTLTVQGVDNTSQLSIARADA